MDAFPSALDLFVAVHRDDVATCQNSGWLPRRLLGNQDYIGFRESAAGAMERASMVFSGSAVNKGTYVVLKLSLSAEALAHLAAGVVSADDDAAQHQDTAPAPKPTFQDGFRNVPVPTAEETRHPITQPSAEPTRRPSKTSRRTSPRRRRTRASYPRTGSWTTPCSSAWWTPPPPPPRLR